MISFQSRNSAIRQADKITRSVNSIYPHISESKSRININHYQAIKYPHPVCYRFGNLANRNSAKLDNLRYRSGEGVDIFRNIIDMLKNKQIGNCYEKSILAQIIGKINGIKNIYPSKIYFNRNSSGYKMQLDHVVAIITDKPFEQGAKYSFKNKDAIVIDPWLGITEYVGDYLRRIKTNFIDLFPSIPDSKYSLKILAQSSKNIEQFNKGRKELFKPDFLFAQHHEDIFPGEYTNTLKKEYPELILK